MRLLFSPIHVQLIAACYPPSASLLTSGPHYHPNSQELSRLTYYAANQPGKIQKLSGELQKRIKLEARKALPNNPRSRA
jgi:protein EFR3